MTLLGVLLFINICVIYPIALSCALPLVFKQIAQERLVVGMGAKMLFRKDFSETKIGSFFNTYAFFRQLASEPIPGQIRESKQEKSPAPPEEKKSKPSFSIFRKAAISKNLAKIQSTATEYAELLLDPYQTCIGHRELPPGTSEVIVGLYNSFKDSEKSAPEGDDLMDGQSRLQALRGCGRRG
jgi:hypothetical protein